MSDFYLRLTGSGGKLLPEESPVMDARRSAKQTDGEGEIALTAAVLFNLPIP